MTQDVADLGEAQGFDAAAARALVLADSEAGQLGHDRVGTEHLLLGLLTNDSATSKMLSDAGVTLTAARNKVSEAVGVPSRSNRGGLTGPLPRTPRAIRALGRSLRFAHARGSEVVTSHHVLMGVLDVEGIAGQVLRGLGLDVDSLRVSLDAPVEVTQDRDSPSRHDDRAPAMPAMCPSCNASLERDLFFRVIPVRGDDGQTRDALIFGCGVCGRVLGAGPA